MFFLSSLKSKMILGAIFTFSALLIWGCSRETETPDVTKQTSRETQVLNLEEASWVDAYIQADTVPNLNTPPKKVRLDPLRMPLNKVRLGPEDASMENPYMQAAAEIQERYSEKIWRIEGVNGFGIGLTEDRRIAFYVGTDSPMTPKTNKKRPRHIKGIPVIYEVTPSVIKAGMPTGDEIPNRIRDNQD